MKELKFDELENTNGGNPLIYYAGGIAIGAVGTYLENLPEHRKKAFWNKANKIKWC
ncbi:MAG: class IIb bacteriocin, lactobin A/cerein 7B family [Paeniclostridium sordellii]|nr:class IIb bacteriocin, lactobin A/cerein 7B family [Paeniclostridium sordellii]